MIKRILIAILVLASLVALVSCGGGSGDSSAPGGVNPGVPSVVKLLPVQFIAQTNSFITLRARVLDGNGNAVPNIVVNFTNMSITGVLSAASANLNARSTVTAVTNSDGNAEIRISSTTTGFATILAQVYTGQGIVRDNKTVFFTTLGLDLAPYMTLDVEGSDSNLTYNDPADYNLFETGVANDTQVTIRATVFNSVGLLVSGITVTFGSDFPYKIGSDPACSDGSTTCEVTFPLGNTATTDFNGQAFVLVQVSPTVLRNITTVLNITALADNGAFNIVSLFLNPVTVSTVAVTANPTTVASGGTSTITAAVTTSAGTPVPDGTTVTFTASAGGSLNTPFAQTTDGIATVILTAPIVTSNTSVSVTASVGGKSGTVFVLVTAPVVPPPPPPPTPALTVFPATATIGGVAGGAATFTVTGGTPSYVITSADITKVTVLPLTVVASGGTFVATVPPLTAAGSVTVQVMDSVGATATVTITIGAAPALSVIPVSGTVTGVDNDLPANAGPANGGTSETIANLSDDYTGLISGGTPPYSVLSSNNLNVVPLGAITFTGLNNENITIDPDSVLANTVVSIIIIDLSTPVKTVTITLTVTP